VPQVPVPAPNPSCGGKPATVDPGLRRGDHHVQRRRSTPPRHTGASRYPPAPARRCSGRATDVLIMPMNARAVARSGGPAPELRWSFSTQASAVL